MKKILTILLVSIIFIANSRSFADPIEGTWRVDEPSTKLEIEKIKNVGGMQAFLFVILMANMEEVVFLKNGKLKISKTNENGTWKKQGKQYLIVASTEDNDGSHTIKATLNNKNKLKLMLFTGGKPIAPIYFTPYTTPESIIAANVKAKNLIQYGRTYRSQKKTSGGYNYLTIYKDNTCKEKAVAKNEHMSANFGVSGSCAVFDGYLVMETGAKAEIISTNKIKYMNMLFILQK